MNFIKSFFQGTSSSNTLSPKPQMYNINGQEYHELTLLAEGGYGFIWRAIEAKTKQLCVLKKIICQSDEAIQQAKVEMDIHRKLNHPNIVQFMNGKIIQDPYTSQTVAILILEMCEGGTLFDLLKRYNEKRLNEKQVLLVLRQIVQAIKYLHSQNPPIQHRDLKVENILLHQKVFKLCDFGSASEQKIDLNQATKLECSMQEEIYQKYTTEMYRPPEMTDIYLKYEVSEKVDIWMLGCILYTMCFYIQPFQEASKLAIVEASFIIPKDSRFSNKMHDLIRLMLTPNPKDRPSILQIEDILSNYDSIDQLKLNRFVEEAKKIDSQIEKLSKPKNLMEDIPGPDDFDDFQTGNQIL